MKTTDDFRQYATELGLAEEGSLEEDNERKVERVRGKERGCLCQGVN